MKKGRIGTLFVLAILLMISGCSGTAERPVSPKIRKVTTIVQAIKDGDSQRVLQLVKGGVDLNKPSVNGEFPLHMAVSMDDIETSKILLAHRADINFQDQFGVTPLMIAVGRDDFSYSTQRYGTGGTDLVPWLLSRGARVDIRDNKGQNVLWYAIRSRDGEQLKRLLTKKINLNQADLKGERPIFAALETKQLSLIDLLVKAKVDLKQQNRYGQTPLTWSYEHQEIDLFRYLLKNSGSINDPQKYEYFITSIYSNKAPIFRALLDNKINVNAVDQDKRTALMFAAENNRLLMVEQLLKAKARINDVDKQGKTALTRAAYYGRTEVIKRLLAAKADVTIKDKNGAGVLEELGEHGRKPIDPALKKLLQAALKKPVKQVKR